VEDLPEEVGLAIAATYAPGDVRPLEEIEREYILAVLAANDGNKAKAADQLAIGTATLYRKLKQYESARKKKSVPIRASRTEPSVV
jgi:two-component system, NtrC family, response regulator HydG